MIKKEKKRLAKLPDAELDVMLALWSVDEPIKTSHILDIMNQEKNWSMSTLQALLARLQERGFVEVQKKSGHNYFLPLVKKEEYRMKETKTFIERLYGNSLPSLVATLIHSDTIDDADLEEIAQMLRKEEPNDD